MQRNLVLAIIAALALALALSEAARLFDRRAVDALETEVAAAQRQADAALAAIIAPETLSKASASVYLVLVDGAPRGTAFVIDREIGVLATAGHTAESLPFAEKGARIAIVNRLTRTPIPVRGAHLHAGYGAFRALIEDYQPVRKGTPIYAPQVAPIRDLAFDAGLIYVDPLDPATGANRLGPALPLASEEKLRALSAGSAIAVIGYPYDTLDEGFAPDAATSRIERGVIAAMIAPLDSALEDENAEIANLIIHRLATAGGNSGSPIINADGEVVGVHTHGIESTSSNADSAAQRADVIYDLLAPERELARLNDVFIPAWKKTLSFWARGADVIAWSFYAEHQTPGIEPAPLVGDIDYAAAAPFASDIRMLRFGAAEEEHRVDAPDSAPQAGEVSGFTLKEPGQYASEWVRVDRSKSSVLYAFDYSLRSRAGFCRLTTYWRRRGEPRLQVQRARPSFELHLQPAGALFEDYQLIYRRDGACDPPSPSFMAGTVSWTPPESATEAIAVAEIQPARGVARILHVARATVSRVFACGASDSGDCSAPEVIEIDAVARTK